jgi:hypothetical protein
VLAQRLSGHEQDGERVGFGVELELTWTLLPGADLATERFRCSLHPHLVAGGETPPLETGGASGAANLLAHADSADLDEAAL